jgi:hypothetical protein
VVVQLFAEVPLCCAEASERFDLSVSAESLDDNCLNYFCRFSFFLGFVVALNQVFRNFPKITGTV